MKRIVLFTAVSGITAFAACSGGGDSNGGRNVAGVWTGAITKLFDSCPGSSAPQTFNFSHNVTQNDEAVELIDENGVRYLGNTVSDDGFSVDGSVTPAGCVDTKRIRYNEIDDDGDNTASAEIDTTRACTGQPSCEFRYSGTAARFGTATPTPTPGATGTPVPPVTTGGCNDINPNPAADSYSGNGGCGISEVVYRVSNGVVVLEPFGSNGATSFAVSSTNTSTAASSRSDLTINGESGYSCSLACSAPSTFSVSCFKEGGTTCNEKF